VASALLDRKSELRSLADLWGEARLQSAPLGLAALVELRAKMMRVSEPVDEPVFALWAPRGVDDAARKAGARGFSLKDRLG
jgi:hypothetical protein